VFCRIQYLCPITTQTDLARCASAMRQCDPAPLSANGVGGGMDGWGSWLRRHNGTPELTNMCECWRELPQAASGTVDIPTIHAALKEMNASPTIMALSNCTIHEQQVAHFLTQLACLRWWLHRCCFARPGSPLMWWLSRPIVALSWLTHRASSVTHHPRG
jgi:hypothetical protein